MPAVIGAILIGAIVTIVMGMVASFILAMLPVIIGLGAFVMASLIAYVFIKGYITISSIKDDE